MTVICRVPREHGEDIVQVTYMTPKLDFGIRIPARKDRELVAARIPQESSDFPSLPALRLHLTHRHTYHGVEMTHLRSAITTLILTSFQPVVLFDQFIQFILVSTQVLVILASVRPAKSLHHESGIDFRMAVPDMVMQSFVSGRVFTQGAFHNMIFVQWIPKYKTNPLYVLPASAAADCFLQLLERLWMHVDQVFFKPD